MADQTNGDRLSRNADGGLTWDGRTWDQLTERDRQAMPTDVLTAFHEDALTRGENGEQTYAAMDARHRDEADRQHQAEQWAASNHIDGNRSADSVYAQLAGNRPTPDPEELRARAAVGSEVWNDGKRYPYEGTDVDPEIRGIAYPSFVSETQKFSWINGRQFAEMTANGFVDLNAELPPASLFGYPDPEPFDGPKRPEPASKPPTAADDVAPDFDWDNVPILKRSQVRERIKREQYGMLLELPESGGWARVKLMNALDRGTLGWVPTHLQGKLAEMWDLAEGTKKPRVVVSTAEAWTRYQKMLADSEELANAFCIHGFIEPRLVATAGEITDPDDETVMVVTELTIGERRSYLDKCIRDTSQEARLLDPFRRKQVFTASN